MADAFGDGAADFNDDMIGDVPTAAGGHRAVPANPERRFQRSHAQVNDDTIAAVLAQVPTAAEEVNLNFNNISDRGCAVLADFLRRTAMISKVVSIELLGNQLTDASAPILSRLLTESSSRPCGAIQRLKIGGNRISAAGIRGLAGALRQASTLRQLHLGGNPIGDEGIQCLKDSFSHGGTKALEVLCLRDVQATARSVDAIAGIVAHCPGLTALQLKSNPIDRVGAEALGASFRHSRLAVLSLQSTSLNAEACATLCQYLGSAVPCLTSIDLSHNPVGDDGVIALSRVLSSDGTKLVTLLLQTTEITEKAVDALADALTVSPTISAVDLSFNRMPNAGAALARLIMTSALPAPKAAGADAAAPDAATDSTTPPSKELTGSPKADATINAPKQRMPGARSSGKPPLTTRRSHGRDLRLSTLRLHRCVISSAGTAAITAALASTGANIRHLDYSSNFSHNLPAGSTWADVVRNNASLERLALTDNELDEGETSKLVEAIIEGATSGTLHLNFLHCGGQSTAPPLANAISNERRLQLKETLRRFATGEPITEEILTAAAHPVKHTAARSGAPLAAHRGRGPYAGGPYHPGSPLGHRPGAYGAPQLTGYHHPLNVYAQQPGVALPPGATFAPMMFQPGLHPHPFGPPPQGGPIQIVNAPPPGHVIFTGPHVPQGSILVMAGPPPAHSTPPSSVPLQGPGFAPPGHAQFAPPAHGQLIQTPHGTFIIAPQPGGPPQQLTPSAMPLTSFMPPAPSGNPTPTIWFQDSTTNIFGPSLSGSPYNGQMLSPPGAHLTGTIISAPQVSAPSARTPGSGNSSHFDSPFGPGVIPPPPVQPVQTTQPAPGPQPAVTTRLRPPPAFVLPS